MIDKEKFVKIINRLKEARDIRDKIYEIYKEATENIEYDYMNAGSLMIAHEDIVIDLLNKIFNLPSYDGIGTDLEWWIYELDFGDKYEDGCITDLSNNPIDLSTPEKLYDYLVKVGSEQN